jgi:hypothetical protein
MSSNNTEHQLLQAMGQVVNNWKAQSQAVSAFLERHKDVAYRHEISPGRNRAIYVFGHIIASNDGIFPLFGFGDRLFPYLEPLFSSNPDKTFDGIPSLIDLKANWALINKTLLEHFNKMTATDWLDRHTKISPEDFAADPLRNKLNVLITRTIHIGYHLGQLNLLTITQN